ncbi:MAG: choline dehydrogenase, partial [Betaproteobacteria bacterium]|nr:choline dehydrogenase [Betaproteobacteria bacterium]
MTRRPAMPCTRRRASTTPLEVSGPIAQVQSEEQIFADFGQRAGSVYHASCTCAMGPDTSSGVVDARLRVHGIAGLRVI